MEKFKTLNYDNSYMTKTEEIGQSLKPLLSRREIEVVIKRLNNNKISQTESNYLSRSVRKKLYSAQILASLNLLVLLDYRRKKYERNSQVLKEKILDSMKEIKLNVQSILLYGSYVQNKHTNYRDIDIMLVTSSKPWKNSNDKGILERKIEDNLSKNKIIGDVNLISKKQLLTLLPYSPLLQMELEEYEAIYGKIRLKVKQIINKRYLYGNLLEPEYVLDLGSEAESKEVYNALRTCISIELFLNQEISNKKMHTSLQRKLGEENLWTLKNNREEDTAKNIALVLLKSLYQALEKRLREDVKKEIKT